MKPFRSRQVIVLLTAFAVGVGSLLVAGSALAETALFRVEQSWHNFPNPAVTTPGGAGKYQGYIQPYVTLTMMGAGYAYPAVTATDRTPRSRQARAQSMAYSAKITGSL